MNNWKVLVAVAVSLGVVSCEGNPKIMDQAIQVARQASQSGAVSGALGTGEIAAGLKEALRVGAENVVGKLGRPNGFKLDPKVHIPLPENLRKAKKIAAKVGLDSKFTDLENRLNAAAEAATPKARALLVDAISQMTLDDARSILNGPDDAATRYFRDKTSGKLSVEMKPIVDSAMAQVGAVQTYDSVVTGLGPVAGMLPDLKTDLSSYVVGKAMDGIFLYLAQEEQAIRRDPAKRTTELLRKVFAR